MAEGEAWKIAFEAVLAEGLLSHQSSRELASQLDPEKLMASMAWVSENASSADIVVSVLLASVECSSAAESEARDAAARKRLQHGPIHDALDCLPLTGAAPWYRESGHQATRARLDLLIWQSDCVSAQAVGRWLCNHEDAYRYFVSERLRGSLRDRSLAARILAVGADGMVTRPMPIGWLAQLRDDLFRLASHPDSIVWIPACQTLGRLAKKVPSITSYLMRWRTSTDLWKQRRSAAALACEPGGAWLARHLHKGLNTDDSWTSAALAIASSIVANEDRELWSTLRDALAGSDAKPEVLWSMVQALQPLGHAGAISSHDRTLLCSIRERAQHGQKNSVTEGQLWNAIVRDTDWIDGLSVDAAFPDRVLEKILSDSVSLGPAKLRGRAASVANMLTGSVESSLRLAIETSDASERSRALDTLESCCRASSLALWELVEETQDGAGSTQTAVDLGKQCELLTDALKTAECGFPTRRALLRCLGSLIGNRQHNNSSPSSRAGNALSALANSPWVASAKTRDLKRFRRGVGDLLWRIGDVLEPESTPTDSVRAIAGWWCLLIGETRLLALTLSATDPLALSLANVEASISSPDLPMVQWCANLSDALGEFSLHPTTLGYALGSLVGVLERAEDSLTGHETMPLADRLEELAASLHLVELLWRDPRAALTPLHSSRLVVGDGIEMAERTLASLTKADASPGEIARDWAKGIGPVLGPIVERVLGDLLAKERKREEAVTQQEWIGPYRKIRLLGQGGGGEVWLVRKQGRRRWVLKIPNDSPKDTEKRALLDEFLANEATLLEEIHAPNVAIYHDHGWFQGRPYLVLEYLIGADLEEYYLIRPLSLLELKPIIQDVGQGLQTLHDRGILHLDMKPANVFLRLRFPTTADENFVAAFREPHVAPVMESVVIDFGLAKLQEATRTSDRIVGTLGFMPPEVPLHEPTSPASDVYGLAATVYAALSGRRFFQDFAGASIVAHATQRPTECDDVQKELASHPALLELLADATVRQPDQRPSVKEFCRRFARL